MAAKHAKRPFEEVVTEHGPLVLRLCRALAGPDAAEDAWSETFVAALRAYPQLPADANLEAWLVTIAKRKVVDQHRARARRAVPVDAQEVDPPVPPDPHAEERIDLWAALATLTTRQRDALAYHYLAGFTYGEIAALLGGTEAAARRAAADGVARLRRWYLPAGRTDKEDR